MYEILKSELEKGGYILENAKKRIYYLVSVDQLTPEQAEELTAIAEAKADIPSATDAKVTELAQQTGEVQQAVAEASALLTLMRPAVQYVAAETYDDDQLMAAAELFDAWEPDKDYKGGELLRHGSMLYRVQQGHTSQAHQPPGSAGMLAVYVPIVVDADGTLDNPIPFANGMDVENGKYYSFEGKVYLAKADMIPCVWNPGTAGMWQWEVIS